MFSLKSLKGGKISDAARAYIHAGVHTFIRTCSIYTYIHALIHTYVRTYVHRPIFPPSFLQTQRPTLEYTEVSEEPAEGVQV